MQDQTYHAHGIIKTHSIVHAVQGKECTHASMKTRKLEFVCLELASFTTNAKQNEKQRKSV